MAKFSAWYDQTTDCWKFNGSIHNSEIASLKLDGLDKLLLEDDTDAPADLLLKLEMIYRHLYKQKPGSITP